MGKGQKGKKEREREKTKTEGKRGQREREGGENIFRRHVHAVKKVRRREVSTCRELVYKSGTGCRDTDLTNHKSRIMATYSSIPAVERTKAEISQLRYAY